MLMKSSISFSKNTLFSESVASASMSSVLRRVELRDWRAARRESLSSQHVTPASSVYQPYGIFGDGRGGAGAAQAFRGLAHSRKPCGIIQQHSDLPRRRRQIVAANRG